MRRPALAAFGHALTGSCRFSAIRGMLDGLYVVATLKWRGAQPLLRVQPCGGVSDVERAADIARAVDAGLAALPAVPTCLRRSLTLLRELRRLEIAGSLHLGVRHGAHGFDAHAWVEVGDVVVNDAPEVVGTYSELQAQDVAPVLQLLA